MFKTIGLIIVLAVAAILLLASTKPSSFRVERSTTIAAPPEKVAALIDDFHQWNAWSPWARGCAGKVSRVSPRVLKTAPFGDAHNEPRLEGAVHR